MEFTSTRPTDHRGQKTVRSSSNTSNNERTARRFCAAAFFTTSVFPDAETMTKIVSVHHIRCWSRRCGKRCRCFTSYGKYRGSKTAKHVGVVSTGSNCLSRICRRKRYAVETLEDSAAAHWGAAQERTRSLFGRAHGVPRPPRQVVRSAFVSRSSRIAWGQLDGQRVFPEDRAQNLGQRRVVPKMIGARAAKTGPHRIALVP